MIPYLDKASEELADKLSSVPGAHESDRRLLEAALLAAFNRGIEVAEFEAREITKRWAQHPLRPECRNHAVAVGMEITGVIRSKFIRPHTIGEP